MHLIWLVCHNFLKSLKSFSFYCSTVSKFVFHPMENYYSLWWWLDWGSHYALTPSLKFRFVSGCGLLALRICGDLIDVERSFLYPLLHFCLSGARALCVRFRSFDVVSKLKPGILPSADLLIWATVGAGRFVVGLPAETILGCWWWFCMKTLRTRIWLLLPVSFVTHFCPC